ncbi:hypothetical protein MUK42_07639 [Musa troglodytarum]|uniref:Uncharacterized protein n=1 Tax=Musa troglodytarum TaxID=320322 RepID=A0A9E7FZG8_9LILI|nr:hypothetical protein MUK42_07639 [Musa troglodytarum]
MGRPLPPGWCGGGYSSIPNPTGSSANFSSQECAEPDSTLQRQTQFRRTCGGRKGGRRRTKRKREVNGIDGGAQRN